MPIKAQFEHTTFVFIPGQLLESDYIAMKNRGWYVVGKVISAKNQRPKLITLHFERKVGA
jgi:hypothetical protein